MKAELLLYFPISISQIFLCHGLSYLTFTLTKSFISKTKHKSLGTVWISPFFILFNSHTMSVGLLLFSLQTRKPRDFTFTLFSLYFPWYFVCFCIFSSFMVSSCLIWDDLKLNFVQILSVCVLCSSYFVIYEMDIWLQQNIRKTQRDER